MAINIVSKTARIELIRGQGGATYEDFDGPYEYNPLLTTQVLPTNDKHMTDNVTFHMIQTRETALPSGGVMFEILG